ncbi:MAG: hypothetical protein IJD98_04640 [Oscillospiraceae bacterium]|nr:hypothetical protein [Oscillospiraceae bacterium]
MTQKPKIQYVGQFYVHGTAARKLEEPKKLVKNRLPLEKLQQVEKIYVDPVALASIAVAVFMLVVMMVGTVQVWRDWAEYDRVDKYVSELKYTNGELTREYRSQYDLEDIRMKAAALGLVPKSEVKTMTVTVTVPEPEPEISRVDEIKAFLEGLFA